ncbi:MAG: DUF58 domain-containing protein [Verrucomicrobiota bacterium]
MEAETGQLTNLLSNAALHRVERLRFNPLRQFTNRSQGGYLARKGGSSTEFADFRDYAPGDDIRFVDWNSFSRLHRPYLKLFHQEEDMHILILIDSSDSMQFEEKWVQARRLAALLGVVALRNSERLSIHSLRGGETGNALFPPCSGRGHLTKMLTFLEELEPGGDTPPEVAFEQALKTHSGRGIAIILSDFLTFGDLKRSFNLLFSAGLELWGAHILAPSELDPELNGDIRLVDSESNQTLDVSGIGDLLGLYNEHLARFQGQIETLCQQRAGRYLSLSSETDLETKGLENLRRQGWLR